ncbi:helix-turn-helix transcriptional regulator [Treponema sp.]|uniref:helix-turn-helix domain-containing protein n=1 Tax=Treponema sp. TaxID=166 RepID=UPI00298E05FB|nr:helix-turn-helix transcriptional regulator [Treponema sp.]
MRKFYGEKIEMKNILRNRDIFIFKTQRCGIIFHNMQVDYSKLWARYKEMGHKNKTDLIEMAGISTNILAKLTKGEFISMDSIQRICKALNCDVGDICVINKVEGNS